MGRRAGVGAVSASAPAPTLWAEWGTVRYPIHLGSGLLPRIAEVWEGRESATALLVSDGNLPEVARRARAALQEGGLRVISASVPPGEQSKSFAQLERLTRLAAEAELRRQDAVVALGGGMVGDLAGFVAASYQRGIRLVHVPTTLLAMVDSAIGGKTGIDLPEGKNYVGAIWQPDLVRDGHRPARHPAAARAGLRLRGGREVRPAGGRRPVGDGRARGRRCRDRAATCTS